MKEKAKIIATAVTAVFACALMIFSAIVTKHLRAPKIIIPNENNTTAAQTGESKAEKKAFSFDYDKLSSVLTVSQGLEITPEMLKAGVDDKETLKTLLEESEQGEIPDTRFIELTGYTACAFADVYGEKQSRDMGNNGKDSFTLGFTGDITFDEESYYVMIHALEKPNKVLDCIDETFQTEMKNADIMLINNEFPYTDRGEPTPGKKYTFRGRPEFVKYLNDMGVDIVSLANNHVSDYGPVSFTDTIDTLNKADIVYVGAGMNAEEANAPKTFIINGYKVGYIACSGVEYPIKTPVAGENSYGVMGSYDDGKTVTKAIRLAKRTCDYVIVFPHWGYENTTELSGAQIANSRAWIDAGADAIIGNHSHCLQGMDYYNGKYIAYSLGNFWFNARRLYTGLLKLEISEKGITPILVPGLQANRETHYISDKAEQRKLYNAVEGYPTKNGVKIDDSGVISPR